MSKMMNGYSSSPKTAASGEGKWRRWARSAPGCQSTSQNPNHHKRRWLGRLGLTHWHCWVRYNHTPAAALQCSPSTPKPHSSTSHPPNQQSALTRKAPAPAVGLFQTWKGIIKRQRPLTPKKGVSIRYSHHQWNALWQVTLREIASIGNGHPCDPDRVTVYSLASSYLAKD